MPSRPCLGVNGERCPNYTTRTRCKSCERRFEAKRRLRTDVTGRRPRATSEGPLRRLVFKRDADFLGRPQCQDCKRIKIELPLDVGFVVHHKDGDTSNNAMPNLELLCDVCHRDRHR